MKKLLIGIFVFILSFTSKAFSDGHGIKMGVILGFTGPIETLTPAMAASAASVVDKTSSSFVYLEGLYSPRQLDSQSTLSE